MPRHLPREREVANLVTERTLVDGKGVHPVSLLCHCSDVPQRRNDVVRQDVGSVNRHHTLKVHGREAPPPTCLFAVGCRLHQSLVALPWIPASSTFEQDGVVFGCLHHVLACRHSPRCFTGRATSWNRGGSVRSCATTAPQPCRTFEYLGVQSDAERNF